MGPKIVLTDSGSKILGFVKPWGDQLITDYSLNLMQFKIVLEAQAWSKWLICGQIVWAAGLNLFKHWTTWNVTNPAFTITINQCKIKGWSICKWMGLRNFPKIKCILGKFMIRNMKILWISKMKHFCRYISDWTIKDWKDMLNTTFSIGISFCIYFRTISSYCLLCLTGFNWLMGQDQPGSNQTYQS